MNLSHNSHRDDQLKCRENQLRELELRKRELELQIQELVAQLQNPDAVQVAARMDAAGVN